MTILLGLICEGGIVIATDTQGTGDNFSLPSDKISIVNFKGDKTLVAKAGNCLLSNRTVEIIQEKADDIELNHPRQLVGLAESAIRQIRDQMIDEDQKKWIAENPFELLLAQCGPYEPSLFLATSLGITNKFEKYYATAGCGAELAECLLNEFILKPKTVAEAVAVAVYIVGKVKRYDPFCGGPTTIKVAPRISNFPQKEEGGLSKDGLFKVFDWPQDYVDDLERELAVSEQAGRPKRMEMLSDTLKKIGTIWWEKHLESNSGASNEQT
jgi:20S proteasome alpha/beta subunit